MYYIPGELIALATFPGVVMHEVSHKLMCDVFNVPVYEVSYFTLFSQRAGHVHHGYVPNLKHSVIIALAPLFFNSILCILFTLPMHSIFMTPIHPDTYFSPLYLFLWWVGISMGANAFPSNQDVNSILMASEKKPSFSLKLLSYLIRLLNFLSIVWASFIYAFLIGFILPVLIFR